MDDIDHKLVILISAEPRMQFRELARRLGISRQGVHRRLNSLTEVGVIQGTTAGVSIPYLDALPVVVFGRSRTISIEETLKKLERSELSHRVFVAGGNYIYVVGLLRKISELNKYAEFVKLTAEMPAPTVGIYSFDSRLTFPDAARRAVDRKQGFRQLSPLDLRIIASLKGDARKSTADIADAVGVSTRTVRRRLDDMISEGSLDLDVRSDTRLGGDMLFVTHVNLREGTDKGEVGKRLLSKYPFDDASIRLFSNIPSFFMWIFWTDKIAEMRHALKEVNKDRDVVSIMPNFVYLDRMYDSWKDKLPQIRARPAKKARARNPRAGSVLRRT